MNFEKKFTPRETIKNVGLGTIIVLSGCSPKYGEKVINQEPLHFVNVTADTLNKLGMNPNTMFELLKKVQFRTDSIEMRASEQTASDTLEVQIKNGTVQQREKISPTDTLVMSPATLLELVDTVQRAEGVIRFILRAEPGGDLENKKVFTFAPDSSGVYRLAYNRKDNTVLYGEKVFKVDPTSLPSLQFATEKKTIQKTSRPARLKGKKAPTGISPTKPIKIIRPHRSQEK